MYFVIPIAITKVHNAKRHRHNLKMNSKNYLFNTPPSQKEKAGKKEQRNNKQKSHKNHFKNKMNEPLILATIWMNP